MASMGAMVARPRRAAAPAAPYQATVLADAPRLYWPLDDAQGTTYCRELVGNGAGAFYRGDVHYAYTTWQAGGPIATEAAPRSLNVPSGVVGYVQANGGFGNATATPAALGVSGNHALTVEQWVYASGAGYCGAFELGGKVDGQYLGLASTGTPGQWAVNFYGPSNTFAASYNAWHLIHTVYDGAGTVAVYLDGGATPALTVSKTLALADVVWAAGSLDGLTWVGSMAQVAVYDKVLTADRRAARWAAAGYS